MIPLVPLRVAETLPLYDILNEFQKGHSHMAVVIKQYTNTVDKPASQAPLDSKLFVGSYNYCTITYMSALSKPLTFTLYVQIQPRM